MLFHEFFCFENLLHGHVVNVFASLQIKSYFFSSCVHLVPFRQRIQIGRYSFWNFNLNSVDSIFWYAASCHKNFNFAANLKLQPAPDIDLPQFELSSDILVQTGLLSCGSKTFKSKIKKN